MLDKEIIDRHFPVAKLLNERLDVRTFQVYLDGLFDELEKGVIVRGLIEFAISNDIDFEIFEPSLDADVTLTNLLCSDLVLAKKRDKRTSEVAGRLRLPLVVVDRVCEDPDFVDGEVRLPLDSENIQAICEIVYERNYSRILGGQ